MEFYTYALFKGFVKTFGAENIYTMDYWPAPMGEVYQYPAVDQNNPDRLLPDWQHYNIEQGISSRIKMTTCDVYPFFYPLISNLPYTAEEEIINMIKNNEFSLFVANGQGRYSINAAKYLIKKLGRDKLSPLIIYDGHDWGDLVEWGRRISCWSSRIKPNLGALNPDLYFLREMHPNGPASQDDRVRPLQYVMSWYDNPNIDFINKDQEKEYDVFILMNSTSIFRNQCREHLEKYLKSKHIKYFGEITRNIHSQPKIPYVEYMKLIAKSRISIEIPGSGFSCFRHWEIPSPTNTLMLRCNPKKYINIREDWTDGENVVNYDMNTGSLIEKLDYLLSTDADEIARKGHEHLITYHKDIDGVQYILDQLENINLSV